MPSTMHRSRMRRIEANQQVQQRRLAAAGFPHDAEEFARLDRKRDCEDAGVFPRIAEGGLVKLHPRTLNRPPEAAVAVPAPARSGCQSEHGVHALIFSFDPRPVPLERQQALQGHVAARHQRHRRDQPAERQVATRDEDGANPKCRRRHQRLGRRAAVGDHQIVQDEGLGLYAPMLVEPSKPSPSLPLRGVEHADHPHARKHLLKEDLPAFQMAPEPSVKICGEGPEAGNAKRDRRDGNDGQEPERPGQHQHGRQRGDQHQSLRNGGKQRFGYVPLTDPPAGSGQPKDELLGRDLLKLDEFGQP